MSQHPDTLSPGYFSDEIIEIEMEAERRINSGPRRKPQVRWKDRYPEWTIDRILELADAHFTRHNKYPTQKSGPILEAPGETWLGVSHSLSRGQRGLDKHVSLAHFLAEHRGVKRHIHGVKLSCDLILNLADQYHERTGHWPTATKELAEGAEGRSWLQIDLALRSGNGVTDAAEPSSLAKLLCAHRGRPHKHAQPEYKLDEILCWAFNHYERTGDWPGKHSGPIVEAPGETWKKVASAFVKGHRGLRGCGYTTLIGFLTEQANRPSQRGRKPGTNLQLPTRPKRTYTNWTVERILELADSYYSSFGKWPIVRSGRINEEIDGTWASIDSALKRGHRGLPGGSSLYALIKDRRGVDTRIGKANLTAEGILLWADNHYERTGLWPNMYSGTIAEAPDESWKQIDQALRHGRRGLPGGGTLASFLRAERPQFSRRLRPLLDIEAVLGYADAFFAREGRWPKITSGPIAEATDQTWCEVNYDIAVNSYGLTGIRSLADLLSARRAVPNLARLPRLTEEAILNWADAFYKREGHWPKQKSGKVSSDSREHWSQIDAALAYGRRGLAGGSSLAKLLHEHRSVHYQRELPALTEDIILSWADACFARTNRWPTQKTGIVVESPNETWAAIICALAEGHRGLPGGTSLADLLERRRGRRNKANIPHLDLDTVLAWANSHYSRTGKWPYSKSGPIPEAPGETWSGVSQAMALGRRGVPMKITLRELLSRLNQGE